jgi:hypothetical protein
MLGICYLKQARDEYVEIIPEEMQKLIDDITREYDL